MVFGWWRRQRDARVLRDRAIPDELWLDTLRAYPFLRLRSLDDLLALREMATIFLDRKEFTAVHGLALSDEMATAVAAQACLPVLKLGLDWYDGFVGIVMHPDEAVAQRTWTDDDGIVHEGEEVLAGEAMPGGPVMLSWRDVQAAGDSAADGYNVVIHEFVHVIDMRGGTEADGMPPMPDAAAQRRWHDVMQAEYDSFSARVEREEDTFLDPYGANGLSEFFPVAAEAFFVSPSGLQSEHPRVYELFKRFFGQDPLAHMK